MATSGIVPNRIGKSHKLGILVRDRWLYYLLLPGLLYFLIFKYLPMWGVLIAFQDYNPFLGFFRSAWVGGKHYLRFFTSGTFWTLFRNTALIELFQLLFYFPVPILLALLLNELRSVVFKRTIQSLIYLPHFLSWVVIYGITVSVLSRQGGVVNGVLSALGLSEVNFLMNPGLFRPVVVGQLIWKNAGWGTIIYLAALAGVDPQLYEAAVIDGANRLQQAWYISVASIAGVILILFILFLGNFLDTGFTQIWLLINPVTRGVGEVFDTFVYRVGIQSGQFSYTAAVGLFKSLVGLGMVFGADRIVKRLGGEGIL